MRECVYRVDDAVRLLLLLSFLSQIHVYTCTLVYIVDTRNDSLSTAPTTTNCRLDSVQSITENRRVRLSGFGSFERRFSPSRPGWNPSKNEPLRIPAQYRVKFRPHLAFRSIVKQDSP